MLVQFVILLWPDLNVWYGPHAVVSQSCISAHFKLPVFSLLFFLPPNLQSMQFIFIGLLLASIALALGYRAKLAAVICFLCLLTIYHRNPFLLHSGDTYLRQQIFWLIFAPAGGALSLERLKRNEDDQTRFCMLAAPWAQRMMQLQFCLLYADSVFHKIRDKSWLDGTAVYYSSHLTEFQKLPIPFIFDNPTCCQCLTYGTLAIEAALFTVIWIKPLRYPVVIAAVIFHLIIDWCMNIPQFEWLMIFSLVLFLDAKDATRLLELIGKAGETLRKRFAAAS